MTPEEKIVAQVTAALTGERYEVVHTAIGDYALKDTFNEVLVLFERDWEDAARTCIRYNAMYRLLRNDP